MTDELEIDSFDRSSLPSEQSQLYNSQIKINSQQLQTKISQKNKKQKSKIQQKVQQKTEQIKEQQDKDKDNQKKKQQRFKQITIYYAQLFYEILDPINYILRQNDISQFISQSISQSIWLHEVIKQSANTQKELQNIYSIQNNQQNIQNIQQKSQKRVDYVQKRQNQTNNGSIDQSKFIMAGNIQINQNSKIKSKPFVQQNSQQNSLLDFARNLKIQQQKNKIQQITNEFQDMRYMVQTLDRQSQKIIKQALAQKQIINNLSDLYPGIVFKLQNDQNSFGLDLNQLKQYHPDNNLTKQIQKIERKYFKQLTLSQKQLNCRIIVPKHQLVFYFKFILQSPSQILSLQWPGLQLLNIIDKNWFSVSLYFIKPLLLNQISKYLQTIQIKTYLLGPNAIQLITQLKSQRLKILKLKLNIFKISTNKQYCKINSVTYQMHRFQLSFSIAALYTNGIVKI